MGNVAPFIAPLFDALTKFNREYTGFINCVDRNSKAEHIAKGQSVYIPRGTASEIEDVVPGAAAKNTDNPDLSNEQITIEAEKVVPIKLDGNESLGLDASGNYDAVFQQRAMDAYRKLANYVESFIAKKAVAGASRAYGDGSSVMFTSKDTMPEFAQINRILDEHGAPDDMRNIVLSNAAMANLRTNNNILLKANQLGSDDFIRYGYTDPVLNLRMWKTAGYSQVNTESTGAGYKVAAAAKKGATTITLDTGTGTIKEGDVIYFGDDKDNEYVVKAGTSAPGDIEIGYPGLFVDVAAATTVTVINKYNPIIGFANGAIQCAFRAPALPKGGDAAGEHALITDPRSGLVFDVGYYTQYHQTRLEIGIAVGASVVMPENVAVLLNK